MQSWFIENLPAARVVLKNFPLLDALLDGFKQYETKRYHDMGNVVLHACLPDIRGGVKSTSLRRLAELEKAIELFSVMDWKTDEFNHFKSRLSDQDYLKSLSIFTELIVAKRLVEKLGRENVELYPQLQNGGFSDILVKIDGKDVYLEVGNLGESLPQSKIQQIIDASAKHLGEKIDAAACYFQVEIDTAELVFDDKGRIDIDASVKKLNSEIDMLSLHELAGFTGWFTIEDIADIVANQSLYESMRQYLTPHERELLELVKSEKIRHWLGRFDISLLKKARLIKSIIGGIVRSLLVEIHIKGFYPSKAAMLERESFLNHVVRNVETQIAEQQLQLGVPNIVMVQGYNWTVFRLGDLEPLYTRIQTFFDEKKESHLSGIAVFSTEFERAVYVSNKYAAESSLLSKEDVAKLGFWWPHQ